MRVLCISGLKAGFVSPSSGEIASIDTEVYEGEIYTVVDEITVMGRVGYVLEEKLPHTNWVYDAKRFAPLSNIDETELIKERQSETLCGHQ
jgi:hypothetical protein